MQHDDTDVVVVELDVCVYCTRVGCDEKWYYILPQPELVHV